MFICLLMKIHKLQFSVKHKSQSRYSVCTPRVTIIVCVPENCAGLYSIQHGAKLPLICGNKMQTRCNRYLLQILFLLNVFGAPLCPSSGAREYYTDDRCLWYLVLCFSSCRYGVELRVVCPVCGLLPGAWCPKHVEQAIRSAIKVICCI